MPMDPKTLTQMLDEIGALLSERLGVRGADFTAKARAARARLPRALRPDLDTLLAIAPRAAHPKVALKTDLAAVGRAHARLTRGLHKIAPGSYAKRARTALIAQIAFQILVVIVGVLVVLRWRGLL